MSTPLLLGTYDPTEQFITFAGQLIDGFAPGTFIKVSRNEDGWTFFPSNSGGGARARNPNKSGRFEFTLLRSSPANAILSAIAVADELSGSGVGECLVVDRSTAAASCMAQNAWIMKVADYERAKEVGEITWIIETDDVTIIHDGLVAV